MQPRMRTAAENPPNRPWEEKGAASREEVNLSTAHSQEGKEQ